MPMDKIDFHSFRRSTHLRFEEDRNIPPKLMHDALSVLPNPEKPDRENTDQNVGAESADTAAEASMQVLETLHHLQTDHRENDSSTEATENRENSTAGSQSKWQQKQAIKREYAAARTEQTSHSAAAAVRSSETEKAVGKSKKSDSFAVKHKKTGWILAGFGALVLLIVCAFSSCFIIFQSIGSSVSSSTYPLSDADMIGAEAQYCALEADLQQKLDNYEQGHDYDECHYDLDEIRHDPYVLISEITALKGGEWKLGEIGDTLHQLFEKQYILTEDVVTETRYRTETRTGKRIERDPVTGRYVMVTYEYEVQVPYPYEICTVSLENFNLSHLPIYTMSEDQISMYALYMGTLGNRPDLFPHSSYVDKYYRTEHEKYRIPPEAMSDTRFASMITEAEKYLGYPYVWGGYKPSTSFDCSGFVSWVCNNCGVGWDFGRLGSDGLYDLCSEVSPADARPGDLIFFEKTYDTDGTSHVGIYVGNSMMIHCGDPIHYASIDTSYWCEHFYAFGRLPNP